MNNGNYPNGAQMYSGTQPLYNQPQNLYPPVQQMPPQAAQGVVRGVYSEAEARAAHIPTDGSTIIFIDQSNGQIYTKQFSFENGSFIFRAYEHRKEVAPVQYATMADLEKLRAELTGRGTEGNGE